MNKFKLELSKKTVADKIPMGELHISYMDGNTKFPVVTRMPTDAQMQAAQDALATIQGEVNDAETIWKEKILIRDQRESEWDVVITARAANCEAIALNDLAALQSTGFPLRSAGGPIGDLAAPANLRVTPRNSAGQMDLRCKSLKGAGSYAWECKLHTDGTPWSAIKTSLSATIRVTGLTPGAVYAFRVRAIGAAGAGDWSDEAVGRAP